MTEEQKRYLRELEATGDLKQIREFAMARCAPFLWSSQESGQPAKIVHNGTITYVDTGQRDLGITNAHVTTSMLKDRAALPDVEAQLGGSTIYPEQRLIDRQAKLDLATLAVPKLFLDSNLAGKKHNRPAGWPPPRLKSGELVIYGGYPGALKEPKDRRDRLPVPVVCHSLSASANSAGRRRRSVSIACCAFVAFGRTGTQRRRHRFP